MVVWSSLRILKSFYQKSNFTASPLKRCMSGPSNVMRIDVSRWQYNKFKDLVHLYIMVGAIPCTIFIFCVNVFIGPATLAQTPEGYIPKHWEYYNHPITRFFARYSMESYQQSYEKYMHLLYEEDEKMKMRRVVKEIKAKMEERHDYEAYYYRPVTAKYFRYTKEMVDENLRVIGQNL